MRCSWGLFLSEGGKIMKSDGGVVNYHENSHNQVLEFDQSKLGNEEPLEVPNFFKRSVICVPW